MIPKTKPRDPDEYYDRREKDGDEIFCYSCGRIIKKTSNICPGCGTLIRYSLLNTVVRYEEEKLISIITFSTIITFISIAFILFTFSIGEVWVTGLIPIFLTWILAFDYIIKTKKTTIKTGEKSE